ncbi:glycosyltransferase [Deltaproteobacteria bacterium Smac51]|nr:glycosyltransferase [Deltaproteobacteria bacterium Smac51]
MTDMTKDRIVNAATRISTGNKLLGYMTVSAITVYLVWRVGFTLPLSYGPLAICLGLLLYACELISGVEEVSNYLGQIRPLPLEKPDIPLSWYPDVDILIATHDEDVNLIYNTVNACRYLDYPDKSKIHVHLCDDGNRREMRELAAKLGANYIGMAEPKHAKAGNMNNALAQTHAPLVAFLDSDMVPRKEFLTEIVPFFFLPKVKKNAEGRWVARAAHEIDPEYKIGFVQTPQNFYNPDLFQYNLYAEERVPNEQIFFFREINVSRNRNNAALLCGSNMIIARAALEEVGYFATDTITEDFETGIKIQSAGWTTYALDICLANGLNPPAVANLIVQRERWGRGCMQTFHNIKPLFIPGIPLARRINYLCTLLYWLTFFCRFIFIISPILVALFGVYIVECSLGELMAFWLPQFLLHNLAMSRISSKTRTAHWSNTVDTIMFPFLVVPILLDLVGVRLKRFKVTDKSHQRNTSANRMLALPHIILLGLSVAGIALCLLDIIQNRSMYNVVILFWLMVNAKSLLLAVFFMLGRTNDRYSYRFYAKLPAEIDSGGYTFQGTTVDLSEGGMSVVLDYPAHIVPTGLVAIRLADRDYRAEMDCSLIQVKANQNGQWVYSFKLEHMDEDSLSNYRQMIYERNPTLPEAMNETLPVIEDIKVNLDKRLAAPTSFMSRKLPRVMRIVDGLLDSGQVVALNDFSYHYVRMSPPLNLGPRDTARVTIEPGVELILAAPEEHLATRSENLYKVLNWADWTNKEAYVTVLAKCADAAKPLPIDPEARRAFMEIPLPAANEAGRDQKVYGPSVINRLMAAPAVGRA